MSANSNEWVAEPSSVEGTALLALRPSCAVVLRVAGSTTPLDETHPYDAGNVFLDTLIPSWRRVMYMCRHITTLSMDEEEAKADFIRHIEEIKAHVPADKVRNAPVHYPILKRQASAMLALCGERLLLQSVGVANRSSLPRQCAEIVVAQPIQHGGEH